MYDAPGSPQTSHGSFLAALVLALLCSGIASAAPTPPGGNGVAKDRGFTIKPPWGPGKSFDIVCGYGCGRHDNIGTQDHFAIDFDMPGGEPVHAIAPGRVLLAERLAGGWEPYGNSVFIEHHNGYQSFYTHLQAISVTAGQDVDVETVIGTVGQSGSGATSDHLHFVLYEGAAVTTSGSGRGPFGGSATVPEPFSGCTLSPGGDCESLGFRDDLRRDDFAPDALAHPDGTLDVFTCTRTNRNLVHRQRSAGGTWRAWNNLQGVCAGSPTAVRDAAGRVYVFVRGLDQKLYYKRRDTALGAWSGWLSLAAPVRGRAAAALDTGLGSLRIFARRPPDDALYYAAQSGTGFGGWIRLGGTLLNSPVAGTRGDGHIDVYVAGLDYRLWKEPALANGTFQAENWVSQGIFVEGEPDLVTEGTLEWVTRTTGDQIHRQLGGFVASGTHPPAAARGSSNILHVFRRNPTTSAADYTYIFSSGGSGTGSLGGLVTSELEAVRAGTGQRIILFTWGTGGFYYREQSSAGSTTSWNAWTDLQVPD